MLPQGRNIVPKKSERPCLVYRSQFTIKRVITKQLEDILRSSGHFYTILDIYDALISGGVLIYQGLISFSFEKLKMYYIMKMLWVPA